MKILHLIPSLRFSGAAKQLGLLATGCRADGIHVQVAVLESPAADDFLVSGQGIPVIALPSRERRGPWAWWRLRTLLHHWQPDLIHVWKLPTLRGLAFAAPGWLARTVLSLPFDWSRNIALSWAERWLLRRVGRVIVQAEAEADLARRHGLLLNKITLVRPAVAEEGPAETGETGGRDILLVGPLEAHKGYRDGVWAFDMLRYVFPEARLTVVGTGPAEGAMRRFAEGVGCLEAIRFVGAGDVRDYLRTAAVCWIPSVRGDGGNAALEAMMAGKPVVAARVPSLDGLILDGQTGLVFPAGDKVELARRTRRLFLDPILAQRLGSAARQRVCQLFAPAQLVRGFQRVYRELAA